MPSTDWRTKYRRDSYYTDDRLITWYDECRNMYAQASKNFESHPTDKSYETAMRKWRIAGEAARAELMRRGIVLS